MSWSHDDGQWLGDHRPIKREIKVQLARHEEQQEDILTLLGFQRNALNRRYRGATKWRRTEIEKLAAHWGVKPGDLTGEISENSTTVPTDP
jgi:hypothetical protein